MQDGIGGPAHGDIETHRILEGFVAADVAGQYRGVVIAIEAHGEIYDATACFQEQLPSIGVSGQQRAVAGQRQAECFGQAVHGVGGKHTGAGAAGRTGGTLVFFNHLITDTAVGGDHHGVNQIEAVVGEFGFTRFHRAPGHKNSRNVEAHRSVKHSGCDLVAIGNAHQRVGAVGVHHVFHRVGDQIAGRQAVEHAVVSHGDPVVYGDGVEFLGDAAGSLYFAGDQLSHILEVNVTGYKLGEGIGNRDNRLFKIFVFHPCGAPESTCASHIASSGGGF